MASLGADPRFTEDDYLDHLRAADRHALAAIIAAHDNGAYEAGDEETGGGGFDD